MRVRQALATAVVGTALATAVLAAPAQAAQPDITSDASTAVRAVSGRFYTDGVNIRDEPNLDGTIRGLGYRSHRITVYCGIRGPLETYWWRITDNTTGVRGYIEQSYGGPSSNPGNC